MKKKLNEIIKEIGPTKGTKAVWTEAMVKGVAKEYAKAVADQICVDINEYVWCNIGNENRVIISGNWQKIKKLLNK